MSSFVCSVRCIDYRYIKAGPGIGVQIVLGKQYRYFQACVAGAKLSDIQLRNRSGARFLPTNGSLPLPGGTLAWRTGRQSQAACRGEGNSETIRLSEHEAFPSKLSTGAWAFAPTHSPCKTYSKHTRRSHGEVPCSGLRPRGECSVFVERWAQSCHLSAPNCTHTQCSSLYRPRHILCGLSWENTMRTTRCIYFEYRCLEIAVYSQKHSAQAASGSMVCPETVAVTVCSALANVLARVPLGANNPTHICEASF